MKSLSRILDALKRVTKTRPQVAVPETGAPPRADRRRSPRWKAHIPLFVYGHAPDAPPFHEQAYSVDVSETGALIVIRETVQTGQLLLLTNKITHEEQSCRVLRVTERDLQSLAVAVEFTQRAPLFWRLASWQTANGSGGGHSAVA